MKKLFLLTVCTAMAAVSCGDDKGGDEEESSKESMDPAEDAHEVCGCFTTAQSDEEQMECTKLWAEYQAKYREKGTEEDLEKYNEIARDCQ